MSPDPGLEVGVLADDLTGALASASRLSRQGLRTSLEWREGAPLPETGAVVVDMGTRDGGAGSDPGEVAARWTRRLRIAGARRIELRIDSTLRGSTARELGGVLKGVGLREPVVIVVPAFPAAGRITVGGVQKVFESGVGPGIGQDVGATVFGELQFETIDVHHVAVGTRAVLDELVTRCERGARRFVIDATTEDDLRAIAAAVRSLVDGGQDVVTVSPGGWLLFYPLGVEPGVVLVILASPTTQNHEQLARLETELGARLVRISAVEAAEAGEKQLADRIDGRAVLVVDTIGGEAGGDEDPANTAAGAALRCLGAIERSARPCLGVVVSGGHAARTLVDALGASGLNVEHEVEALCSRASLLGGGYEGLGIITKGGVIGSEGTLSHLVREFTGAPV